MLQVAYGGHYTGHGSTACSSTVQPFNRLHGLVTRSPRISCTVYLAKLKIYFILMGYQVQSHGEALKFKDEKNNIRKFYFSLD
ncbi:MAG: hypothetical protein GQ583_08110 [Methyloprofundus sp.]|nr:hypothetical protein [Methyloprofundus sp.]